MGYKYQFITLAGIHIMWFNMFDLAQDYAAARHAAYVEKVQEQEFAARDRATPSSRTSRKSAPATSTT